MLEPVDLSPDLADRYRGIVKLAGNLPADRRRKWFDDIRDAMRDPISPAPPEEFKRLEALRASFEKAQLAIYIHSPIPDPD